MVEHEKQSRENSLKEVNSMKIENSRSPSINTSIIKSENFLGSRKLPVLQNQAKATLPESPKILKSKPKGLNILSFSQTLQEPKK